MKPLLILASLCMTLVACAKTDHLQTQALLFQTLITADRFKRFEVSVTPKPLDPLRSVNSTSARDNDGRAEYLQRSTDLYLRAELEAVLEKNGFCREGYLLLGRFAGQNQYRLRGECKDLASDQDRQQFPNTIQRW